MESRRTNDTPFWDWLRRRFANPNSQRDRDREPRRRGIAITFCVLIATVLWFTITMQKEYPVDLQLPLQVNNLDTDRALASLPDTFVRVGIEGEGFQLLRLYYNPPTVTVRASDSEVNLQQQVQEVLATRDVDVGSVQPANLQLETEPRIEKRVPVRLNADIRPARDYELVDGVRIEPDSVTVSGAESLVRGVEAWPTEYFERENLMDSLRLQVALKDTLSGLVGRSPTQVLVRAAAAHMTEGVRQIDVQPRWFQDEDTYVSFVPDFVTVRYKVPIQNYGLSQDSEQFYATVDMRQLRDDTTGVVRPTIETPEGLHVQVLEVEPDRLQYLYRIQD